jgi:hypothetical protein
MMTRTTAKIIGTIGSVAAAAAMLTACGTTTGTTNDADRQRPATTAPADPTPPPAEEEAAVVERGTAAERQAFLTVVRDEIPALEEVPNRALLDIAYITVDTYRAGASLPDLIATFTENGLTLHEAGFFMGAAVEVFAPELSQQLQEDADAYDANMEMPRPVPEDVIADNDAQQESEHEQILRERQRILGQDPIKGEMDRILRDMEERQSHYGHDYLQQRPGDGPGYVRPPNYDPGTRGGLPWP